jgi:hypothetical protein
MRMCVLIAVSKELSTALHKLIDTDVIKESDW